METKPLPTHEVDFEGEEPIHRHPRFNLFCPLSFDHIAFASAYTGTEGRRSAMPVSKPMSYYMQQIKTLTTSIQLLQKNGDRNIAALLQQYFARAFAHERVMETEKAMKDYTTCIRLDSKLAPAYFNRALMHYDRFEYQLALNDLNTLVQLKPKEPLYLEVRSLLNRKLNKCIAAGEDLEMAARLRKTKGGPRAQSSITGPQARNARLSIAQQERQLQLMQLQSGTVPNTPRLPQTPHYPPMLQQRQHSRLSDPLPPTLVYKQPRRRATEQKRHKKAKGGVPPELLAQKLMEEKLPGTRTDTDLQRIAHELQKVACIKTLKDDYNALQAIARAITLRRYSRDTYVFKTGDVGVSFFILYEGSIMITAKSPERQAEILLKRLNTGDGFGEGVLYNPDRKRTANALCDQDSIVLVLPLGVYVDIMNNVTDRLKLLKSCVMFRAWSEERLLQVANKMRPKQFDSNTTILRAGELVQELYIIKTGMARVLKRVPASLLRKRRSKSAGEPKRKLDFVERMKPELRPLETEVPGFWAIEEEGWLDREEQTITDPLAVKSYEITVGVLGSCQVVGEMCVLSPTTPSPVTVVAYTIIELYAIKKEELEGMGCAFDVPLTSQLNESMLLHNPSSSKVAYMFRRKVDWEKKKETMLQTVMPRTWLDARKKGNVGLHFAKTYGTVVLRQLQDEEGKKEEQADS